MNDDAYKTPESGVEPCDPTTNPNTPWNRMQAFLELHPEDVRSHLTVVTAEDVGQDYFLRVDKNVPEKYIPNMPKSAMKKEDNTVPRVTVAPSLIGCIIGYFRSEHDVVYAGYGENPNDPFRGGYAISRLNYELALKPDETLVPDQERSNEHWLVSYDENTIEYVPEQIGKCWYSDITYLNAGGDKLAVMKLTLWLEVEIDNFNLTPGTMLRTGYYEIKLWWRSLHGRNVNNDNVLHIYPRSKEEYFKQKQFSANLLELAPPAFTKW